MTQIHAHDRLVNTAGITKILLYRLELGYLAALINGTPSGGTGMIPLAKSKTGNVAQDSILVLTKLPKDQLRKLGYSQFANGIRNVPPIR